MKNRITGSVKSYDGTQIYYEAEGSGRPLIFCYGVVCNARQWKYQIRHFRKKYQVIYIDYRGHNRSESPKNTEHLTIRGCARDIDAVMRKLKLTKAALIGHSMGVNVIFQFAADYPTKVAGLIAICGTLSNPFQAMFHTDVTVALFELLKLAYIKFPKQFPILWKKAIPSPISHVLTTLLGFNYQLVKKREIKNYLDGVAQQPLDTFFYLLQDMSRFQGNKILKQVKAPTLIIAGRMDLITPIECQRALYRKLKKRAILEEVPTGSHCAHIDMPKHINARIEKFLKKIGY